jgi:drug/metabolite transporter (DMT)-like permease
VRLAELFQAAQVFGVDAPDCQPRRGRFQQCAREELIHMPQRQRANGVALPLADVDQSTPLGGVVALFSVTTMSLPEVQNRVWPFWSGVDRWRVPLALIVASLLWGSLYPAAKPALAATGPMQITFCRVLLAFASLGLLILLRSGPGLLAHQLRAHWRAVLILGLFNFAISQILTMSAQTLLPASVNGLLNNTHPLWVAIASALFYPPPRPGLLVSGSAVALFGVALVFLPDLAVGAAAGAALSPLGIALSLAGSGVIAIGTGVGRRVMVGGEPLAITTLALGAAILPMAALTLANGGFDPILRAASDVQLLLLYLGIGCTAVNFALWYYGLKHTSAATASAFQYLIAPTSVALAALFLHERISPTLILGTLCILTGLFATQIASTTRSVARRQADPAGGQTPGR